MSFKPYAQFRRDPAGFIVTIVTGPGQVHEIPAPNGSGLYEFPGTHGEHVVVESNGTSVQATISTMSGETSCAIDLTDVPATGHSKVRYFSKGGFQETKPAVPPAPATADAPTDSPAATSAPAPTATPIAPDQPVEPSRAVAALLRAISETHDATHPGPFRWCYEPVCRAAGRVDVPV